MTSSPFLEQGSALQRVATGAVWAEGPVWLPQRRSVRFSDIPNNRIVEFSEETGDLTVFEDNAEFTNGRTLDLDGSVVECSHGRRAVQHDTAVRPGESPAPQTLVDRSGEVRLNSPNDVVVKSDGTIWFSDPSYGIMRPEEGHAGEEEYGDRYVFRFDPHDGSLVPVVIDVEAPNGLAFSPDEKTLYVADSSASPASGGVDPDRSVGHAIHAYDVYGGRHAKNGRVFAEVSPGLPDVSATAQALPPGGRRAPDVVAHGTPVPRLRPGSSYRYSRRRSLTIHPPRGRTRRRRSRRLRRGSTRQPVPSRRARYRGRPG